MINFVRRTNSDSPSERQPPQQDHLQVQQGDEIRLIEANQGKRANSLSRRNLEAQTARVSIPRRGRGGFAHGPNPHNRANRGGQHNTFDTDSEHADDTTTTGFSFGPAPSWQAGPGLKSQPVLVEQKQAQESDEEEEHLNKNEDFTRTDEPHIIPDQASIVTQAHPDMFGNGESYPPTTAGEQESDDLPQNGLGNCEGDGRRTDVILPHHRPNSVQKPIETNAEPLAGIFKPQQQQPQQQHRPVQQERKGPTKVTLQQRHVRDVNEARQLNYEGNHALQAQAPANFTKSRSHSPAAPAALPAAATPADIEGETLDVFLEKHDYSAEDIPRMTYEALQNQSFDFDPAGNEFVFPDDVKDQSLSFKLQHVKSGTAAEKAKFCNSLSIDEWEEAGDWFLEQFQGLVDRFREARRNKRRAAAELENEIYRRHKQIEAKKRKLDEALGEMKASGGAVLSGTPRPSKRKA